MIVVGAPVHERGWVLQHWFDHLAAAAGDDIRDMHVVLNYGESTDDTMAIISTEKRRQRFGGVHILLDEGEDHHAERNWTPERYETMVRLRNDLLNFIRLVHPDYYLSCDTDMLLAPDALRILLREINEHEWRAIGPLTHMMPTGTCPNAFGMDGERIGLIHDSQPVFAVFGVVLMRSAAYQQDYAVHRTGEDVGWAINCWKNKVTMGIAPAAKAKHVMNPQMLQQVDPRVGF